MTHRFQAAVVGMGPAGMAAAIELARAGVKIALIDQAPLPGGQVYRQPPGEFSMPPGLAPSRHNIGHALRRELAQAGSSLTFLNGAVVWGAFSPGTLSVHQTGRNYEVSYEKLVICEGAQERIIPCPGWTLPGVISLGGLQKMITTQGIAPRGRVLLAGSGPLLIGTAAAVVGAGASLVGVYEAVSFTSLMSLGLGMMAWPRLLPESFSYMSELIFKGVKVHFNWGLKTLSGDDRVREATLVRLDGSGAPIPGSERIVPVDVVGIGSGLQPHVRLARLIGCRTEYDPDRRYFAPVTDTWGQSSQTGVYIAGDGGGVGGADWSEVQGRISGLHASWSLNRMGCDQLGSFSSRWLRSKRRLQAYVNALHRVFTPKDGHYSSITPETVICRCEAVRAGDLMARMKMGEQDLTALKPSRLAMGPCQGRGCEGIATEMLRLHDVPRENLKALHLRPPIIPMPLSAFSKHTERVSGSRS
ncbi:MAG: FAD-dependent oxidoreductase [Deltaproteobacteria bacterium]|nr:FAD-dependent oxidoreductase [Deltaproteobacteria bacterium]